MSFDPGQVAALRTTSPRAARAASSRERRYDREDWAALSTGDKAALAHFLHAPATPPAFRRLCGQRSAGAGAAHRAESVRPAAADLDGAQHEDRGRAARFADQMIFEGFRP